MKLPIELRDMKRTGKNATLPVENAKKIIELEKALAYAEAIVTTISTPLLILYLAF